MRRTYLWISIHALCEEGDHERVTESAESRNFYPRPLRGGRPDKPYAEQLKDKISIHALCEEGDPLTSRPR